MGDHPYVKLDFSKPILTDGWPEEMQNIKAYIEDFLLGKHVYLNSSGSTGRPKEISFTAQQVEASAKRTMSALGIDSGDSALVLPAETTGGRMLLYRALIFKMKLFVCQPSISIPMQTPVDLISVTPAQWYANTKFLSTCKRVLIGGGVLRPEVKSYPSNVFHSYGMTETLSNVALMQPGKSNHFTALQGVHFATSDQGTLIINDEELGIKDLQTNDVVKLIDSRRFVFLHRGDHVINSGGIKIHLNDWYRLWKDIGGQNVQLVGVPDDDFGQVPVLLVLNHPDIDKMLKMFKMLPKYWQPKKIYLVNQWAYTSSGKPKIFLYPNDISELAGRMIYQKN
ncbi:MAG: hypothetical protein LAT54_02955 [Cryomorphaceae bacterium]|nr:hypothetical protein [Cryomorphaceae bacterium]